MKTSSTELGSETHEAPFIGRKIESLDDIPRELADRRLHAEFGEHIAPEESRTIREIPDRIEKSEEFTETARQAGHVVKEGDLGYSTRLEAPAHVLKGDVGTEIATLIHEDLHRVTSPETLMEIHSDPKLKRLYEGVTEHFTERASEGLFGFEPGKCYPEEVEAAKRLGSEVGEKALRDWFFKHELTDELRDALDRISV
jgi:hypothetical protein